MFRDALKFMGGFDVREAADGIDALRMIDEHQPDLIVLDVGLPMLDGLSVRDELASRSDTNEIPIIVVTGTSVDIAHLKDVPILRKPVLPDDLLASVRAALATVLGKRLGIGRDTV